MIRLSAHNAFATDVEKIRAFIAIDIPEEIKDALSGLQARLLGDGKAPGRVRPGSMHLTLKFLGNVEHSSLAAVSSACREAAEGFSEIHLSAAGVAIKGKRVLWVAMEENPELSALKERLETKLALLGFKAEGRRFTGHITLARIRSKEGFGKVQRRLREEAPTVDFSFTVRDIKLFKSELGPRGASHTELGVFAFH